MLKVCIIFLLSTMLAHAKPTLEEMISQMIVIGFEGQKEGDKWVEQIAKDIKRQKIGGVFLHEKNIQNPLQLKKLTHYLSSNAPQSLPLMVIAQDEGGEETLLHPKKGFSALPSAQALAKYSDIDEAEKWYDKRAEELYQSGITINLAPVLDLQPKNSVPIERRYSSHEEMVTTYAMLFINALKTHHVMPVVKYFPTAGANLTDHFTSQVDVTPSWQFEQLKPYYDLISVGHVEGVLMSHVWHKELDQKNPALFSSLIIGELLRGKMHFEGLVFVDNLRTDSIAPSIDFKTRIIRSIQAGVDVLIFPNYFADNASAPFTVSKIITDAVRLGEISKERIALSYERIEKHKHKTLKRQSHVD
jgi:beta-N-acetylhexosaminidase